MLVVCRSERKRGAAVFVWGCTAAVQLARHSVVVVMEAF